MKKEAKEKTKHEIRKKRKKMRLSIFFFSLIFHLSFAVEEEKEKEKECSEATIDVDAIFAVDTSNSVHDDDVKIGMQFVANFIDFLGKNYANQTRFGMFQYSNKTPTDDFVLEFGFHQDWAKMRNVVTSAKRLLGTSTKTLDALDMIKNVLVSAPARKNGTTTPLRLGFILTDGQSSLTRKQIRENAVGQMAKSLAAANISMYGIGIGKVNKTELLLITGSENHTIYAKNYAALSGIEEHFHRTICKKILDSSNLIIIAKISGAVIVAICFAGLVALAVIYKVQSVVRERLEVARLQQAQDDLRQTESVVNPMYKDPVSRFNIKDLVKGRRISRNKI